MKIWKKLVALTNFHLSYFSSPMLDNAVGCETLSEYGNLIQSVKLKFFLLINGRSLLKAFIRKVMRFSVERTNGEFFAVIVKFQSKNLKYFHHRTHFSDESNRRRTKMYCKFAQEIAEVVWKQKKEIFPFLFLHPLESKEARKRMKFTLHFRYLTRTFPNISRNLQQENRSTRENFLIFSIWTSTENWKISRIKTFFIGMCFRLFLCKIVSVDVQAMFQAMFKS